MHHKDFPVCPYYAIRAYLRHQRPGARDGHQDPVRHHRAIAKAEPRPDTAVREKPARTTFRAVKGKYRKPGTGCVSRIGDQLWEGRYSPKVNGKRITRNIYAHSEEECEEKLAELIKEMKEEIAALGSQPNTR